jgi:hypothetical protein
VGEQDAFEFEEQQEQLERVSARIARPIITFCKEHKRFHADELRRYVVAEIGVTAPGSADRVLRDLRQQGRLNYRVVSRRESLYEVIEVKGAA